MGESQELILHINGWLLAGVAFAALGVGIYVIYLLLTKLASMVIEGIHVDIHSCQTELMTEINAAHAKAEAAHQHAENAHTRAGRLEVILMENGAKKLEKKP